MREFLHLNLYILYQLEVLGFANPIIRVLSIPRILHGFFALLCNAKTEGMFLLSSIPYSSFSQKYVASISAVLTANARGYISNAFPTLPTGSLPENPI